MKSNKRNSSKRGFTLIEMVIVMAIMAILIGLVAPGAMKQIKNAKAKADMASARDVATAITQGIAEGNIDGTAVSAASAVKITLGNGTTTDSTPKGLEKYLTALPVLKVKSGSNYYYYYYYENEQVHILVGTDTSKVELYPNYDSAYIK